VKILSALQLLAGGTTFRSRGGEGAEKGAAAEDEEEGG